LKVIPVLESISEGATLALARSSANLSQWRDITDIIIDESLNMILDADTFQREKYLSLPRAVRLGILWVLSDRPRGGRLELEKTDRWILEGKNGYHTLPGGSRITADGCRIHISVYTNDAGKEEN